MKPRAREPGAQPATLFSLTLLTTFKCNFACQHCGYRSNPGRTEVLDVEVAKRVIREACAHETMRMVAFTGGEPFLYPQMLRELVVYCESLGLDSAVVTNSFWATSPEKARAALEELAAHRLVDFTTSFDWFHLEFTSADRIRHAVHAALGLGLRIHINIVVSRNGSVNKNDVCRELALEPAWIAEGGPIEVKELSPVPVGYAEDCLADDDLIRFDERWMFGRPCYFAIRNPVLSTTGDLYGCCGFGGGTDLGPSELLKVGNVNEASFDELWERLRGNLAYNIISQHGPNMLLQMVKERWPDTPTRGEYVFNCEVCHEIARSPDLQAKIRAVLHDLAGSVAK
jgi:MoaA/NifB/PqqE/SkfB family radical SAM enzyme